MSGNGKRNRKNVPLLIIIGFCLWVWAELVALVAIGGELGVLLTIAGIFVTAMVGIWLLRNQGRAIMSSLQAQLARGERSLYFIRPRAQGGGAATCVRRGAAGTQTVPRDVCPSAITAFARWRGAYLLHARRK